MAVGTTNAISKDDSKIDTAGTGLAKAGTTINHSNSVTANTAGAGSATAVPIIKYDAQGHITSVTTATIYPPTSAGTSGQVWKSDGSGAGVWESQSNLSVGSATTATKLGSSNVGGATQPIYLNAGAPTAGTALSAGAYKAMGSVASGNTGIVTGGDIYTALTNGTVNKVGTATKGSATKPIYLNAGVPTEGTALAAGAYKAMGSVASGNTGLVTGGDVYTAVDNVVNNNGIKSASASITFNSSSDSGRVTSTFLDTMMTLGDRITQAFLYYNGRFFLQYMDSSNICFLAKATGDATVGYNLETSSGKWVIESRNGQLSGKSTITVKYYYV